MLVGVLAIQTVSEVLRVRAGATPAYVMVQMGHTDASLALEIYSKVMERTRDTGARMDALIQARQPATT